MNEYKSALLRAPVSDQQASDVRLLVSSLCCAIWAGYGFNNGKFTEHRDFVDTTMDVIKFPDIFDAVQFTVAKFDPINQSLFANMVADMYLRFQSQTHVAWLHEWVVEVLLPQIVDGLALFESLEGR